MLIRGIGAWEDDLSGVGMGSAFSTALSFVSRYGGGIVKTAAKGAGSALASTVGGVLSKIAGKGGPAATVTPGPIEGPSKFPLKPVLIGGGALVGALVLYKLLKK